MIIIGITGTLGSGKGTVVKYLVNKYGFQHYSASDFLKKEIARRGITENRDNMVMVGNDLRATHNPGYVIEQLYNQAVEDNKANPYSPTEHKAVIESIRSIGEVQFLKSQDQHFYLVAVDANPRTRYERVLGRKSTKDDVSFEEFLEDEQVEMNDMTPSGMNLVGCMKLADKLITNDTDLESLQNQIDQFMNSIIK